MGNTNTTHQLHTEHPHYENELMKQIQSLEVLPVFASLSLCLNWHSIIWWLLVSPSSSAKTAQASKAHEKRCG